MSNYKIHAEREFRAAGWTNAEGKFDCEMQELICKHVLKLLDVFAGEGHSGSSAPYTIDLFSKLAKFEPIIPLQGTDDEWNNVGNGTLQNKRCGRVFKSTDRFGGQAYDIDAIVFWDWYTNDDGERSKSYFTSSDSCQPITFPYTPKTEYKERK